MYLQFQNFLTEIDVLTLIFRVQSMLSCSMIIDSERWGVGVWFYAAQSSLKSLCTRGPNIDFAPPLKKMMMTMPAQLSVRTHWYWKTTLNDIKPILWWLSLIASYPVWTGCLEVNGETNSDTISPFIDTTSVYLKRCLLNMCWQWVCIYKCGQLRSWGDAQ